MENCESCSEEEFDLDSWFIVLTTMGAEEDLNGNENLVIQCPYMEFGCRELILASDQNTHIKNCSNRPLKCFQTNITECKGKDVDFGQHSILNHLIEEHKVCIDRNHDDFSPSLEWARIYFDPESPGHSKLVCPGTVMECVYKYKGKYFFKNSNVENGIRFWWFSILGSEERAKKYRACLRIKKLHVQKQNVRVPQWVLPVVSFRKTFAEVLQSRKFASFKLSSKSLDPYSTCDVSNSNNDNSNDNGVHNCKFYNWCTEIEILTS